MLRYLSVFSLLFIFTMSCVTNQDELEQLQLKYEQTQRELDEANLLLMKSADQRRLQAESNAKLQEKLGDAYKKEGRYQESLRRLNDEKSGLQHSLSVAEAYAEESRRMAERRNQILQSYMDKLRSILDGGQLDIEVSDGRLLVRLPTDILFASGSAKLSQPGKNTLSKVASVLASGTQNHFQIEGHTDTDPIRGGPFKTNWHLGYGRAMSVLNVFLSAGVQESMISAASFGQYRPRASNDEVQGKALNRRIEIVMIPDLSPVLSEDVRRLGYRN